MPNMSWGQGGFGIPTDRCLVLAQSNHFGVKAVLVCEKAALVSKPAMLADKHLGPPVVPFDPFFWGTVPLLK